MKHLLKAVPLAWKYKYSLIFSIVCSAMVAVLWGANITAVYPFVEVVFQGQTLHDWIDEQVESVETEIARVADARRPPPGPRAAARRAGAAAPVPPALQRRLHTLQSAQRWIERFAPRDPFLTLVALVAFLLVGTLVKSVFRIASLMLVGRATGRMTADLRNEFFRALLADRPARDQAAGDAAARVGGDMTSIGTAMQTLFGRSVQEPLKMAACLVGAAAVNWRLLLFSLLACPAATFLLLSLAKSIRRASLRAFDQKCLLMGRMLQTFQGLHVVKAYNMESHERRRFWQHTHRVYREQLKITWYEGLIRSNNELLGIGVLCLSALAGGYLVLNQKVRMMGVPLAARPMDFGQIMLFYAFLIGCTDPLRKMADVFGAVQKGAAAAERIMPFISIAHKPNRNQLQLYSARQPITFEHVNFHYYKRRPVLQDVSFRVECGETLAIIGPNGCGKTTLINLLLRFYAPVEGRILLGDVDLQQIRRKHLRRRIALVSQRAVLFNDTVFNNIAYGTRHATREQVIEAARKAHAHEFIMRRLTHGYETNCGDGGKRLSGGQQQRIALARAILRDPDILILDEAASQIDPKSEQLIQESLSRFVNGRTTLMITHRLSTLDLADRILVMDAGQIVDVGTHDELIERCPAYQALRQSPLKRSA
jgi:ATP-binding cassette subfamily B protein/subfamily B ATP-binding cassette protein MsbA